MAAGVESRAEFAKLLEPTLRKAFFKEYNVGGSTYDKYWDVQDSYKAKEEIVETIVPVDIPKVGEGGMFARGEMRMGRSKTFTHATFKLEIVMTEELQEDNLYGAALSTQKAMAVATTRTIEKIGAHTYAEGLTTTLCPDGKPVFAPNHPVLYPSMGNPSTWSNVLSSTPFGSSSVKSLKTLLRKQRDELGELSTYEGDQLLVGPDLYEEALEMYGSPGRYDSADRAKNQAAEGLIKPLLVGHFLTANIAYPASFHALRDSRTAMNIWYWRRRPRYDFVKEESTNNIIQRVSFRTSCGFVNPRGHAAAYGSN